MNKIKDKLYFRFEYPNKHFKIIEFSVNDYYMDWDIVIILLGFGFTFRYIKD